MSWSLGSFLTKNFRIDQEDGSAGRSEIHICSAFFGETIKEAL